MIRLFYWWSQCNLQFLNWKKRTAVISNVLAANSHSSFKCFVVGIMFTFDLCDLLFVSFFCLSFVTLGAKMKKMRRWEDESAFRQHRKFPLHAGKTSGTQGSHSNNSWKEHNYFVNQLELLTRFWTDFTSSVRNFCKGWLYSQAIKACLSKSGCCRLQNVFTKRSHRTTF